MSLWLVKGGHRAQLLPFHQASQRVSRLVPSSVNAPPTLCWPLLRGSFALKSPRTMTQSCSGALFMSSYRVSAADGRCLPLCGTYTHTTNKLLWSLRQYGSRHPAFTLPAARSDCSIATPAYLSSAGAVRVACQKALAGSQVAVVRLSKSHDVEPKLVHSSRCVYERPPQFHVARVRAKNRRSFWV